jgi:predicted MFS family arabinose efflux permease
MYPEWKSRISASVILILLFSTLLFLIFPRQPTYVDILLVFIGVAIGFFSGLYIIQYTKINSSKTRATASENKRGYILGTIIGAPIIIFSVWFGEIFIISMSLIALPCFLVVMVCLVVHYWGNRPA